MKTGRNCMWYCMRINYIVEVDYADTFWKRLKGLMFRKGLEAGKGLMITPCAQIHTMFMRFPIDIIYLDKDNRVLQVETIPPWRTGKHVSGCHSVLELNAGGAQGIAAGDRFEQ